MSRRYRHILPFALVLATWPIAVPGGLYDDEGNGKIRLNTQRGDFEVVAGAGDTYRIDTTYRPNSTGRYLFRVRSNRFWSVHIEADEKWEFTPGQSEIAFRGLSTGDLIGGELFFDWDVSDDQANQGGTGDLFPVDPATGVFEYMYIPAGDYDQGIGVIVDVAKWRPRNSRNYDGVPPPVGDCRADLTITVWTNRSP